MVNKSEFKVLAMLYVANIDGNVHSEEIKTIIEKTGGEAYENVNKMFGKMSDAEVLECIMENKKAHITNEAELEALISDCRAIISADENNTVMEEFMVNSLKKVLA